MRVLTIAGRWLAAVLGLSVLCIVLLLGFFNPNARRNEIQTWVSEQTGRRFTLDGELGWQMWPRLAVTLPRMQLGAAPGDARTGKTSGPFAEWQQASISVRLWPLLRGRLEFGAGQLRGVRVRLQRDAAGRNNWQDLLQRLDQERPPGRFQFANLAGFQMEDAEFSFEDAVTRRITTLRIDLLSTTAVAFNQPIGLTLKARVGSTASSDPSQLQTIAAPFTLAMQVQTDAALQQWQVNDLQFAAQLTTTGATGQAINALPVSLQLQHAEAHIERQLMLHAVQMVAGEARLTADQVQVTRLRDAPRVEAGLQLDAPSLRRGLQQWAINVPGTRDATVLQHLSAHLQVMGSAADLQVQVKSLLLDDTRLSGMARWRRAGNQTRYTVDMRADQLDLDRYLPAASSGDSRQAAATPVPLDWLRSLHAQGRLQIDAARWQGIRAHQLTITLDGM